MVDHDSAIATPRTAQVDAQRDDDGRLTLEAVLAAVHDADEGVAVVQFGSWQ